MKISVPSRLLCLLATLLATLSVAAAEVAESSILRRMDANRPFATQDWRVLCDGQQAGVSKVPESGISGPSADGKGQVLKFGKTPSPSGDGTTVLLFRAQPNNVPIGGTPRCEGTAAHPAQAIPRRQVFWHAFSIWIDNWAGQRDMMAVTQWYHGMPGAKLNPSFVLVASGPRLYGQVRTNNVAVGKISKEDLDLETVFEITDGSFYGRWLNMVVLAKVSPDKADNGFLTVYLNGRQLGTYRGPIGYATEGAGEFPRHGVYPLVRKKPWDLSKPVRDLYLRRSIVVADPDMKLRPDDLFRALN